MSSHGLTVSQNCLEVFPPLVSVIIPAFNAAETISETLESVLAQSYSNVEIIVVDDGSTDQTQIALAAFGNRVTSIRQANGGLANARNAGCRMARGTFIALMDADDLCVPDRIAIQVEVLASLPNVVLCASDFTTFDRNGPIEEYGAKSYYSKIQQAPQGLISLYPEKHVVELRTIPHAVNPLEI